MLAGVLIRIPGKHERKRKYVRPIDTVMPACTVLPWKNGGPVNLLSGDLR